MWGLIPNTNSIEQTLSGDELAQFLAWYEEQKNTFHTKEGILAYCMDDVSMLRQTYCVLEIYFRNWLKLNHSGNR